MESKEDTSEKERPKPTLSCVDGGTPPKPTALVERAFFDLSGSSTITYFNPNPDAHSHSHHNSDQLKARGLHALETARAHRHTAHTTLVWELAKGGDDDGSSEVIQRSEVEDFIADEDASEEYSDSKSDAGTGDLSAFHHSEEDEEEEMGLDDLFREERVRKKIELLAGMVGVRCNEAPAVLAEVVRVLKELRGDR